MSEHTPALLPCPFCGGAPRIHAYVVVCDACNLGTPIFGEPKHDGDGDAVITWNRRAPVATDDSNLNLSLIDRVARALVEATIALDKTSRPLQWDQLEVADQDAARFIGRAVIAELRKGIEG